MITFSIGRDKENKYIIHDPQAIVSGRHGYLSWDKSGNIIYTDTSTNGTIINGKKYDKGSIVSVKRGDHIIIAGIAKLDWNKVPNIIYPDKIKNIYGIGRDSNNEILIDETSISRFHATIVETIDNKLYIIDHSSNGTKINGEQIVSYIFRKIKRRDKIQLGIHNSALNWKKVPINKRAIIILLLLIGIPLMIVFSSLVYKYRCKIGIVNCPSIINPASFYDSSMVIVYNKFFYTANDPTTKKVIAYYGRENKPVYEEKDKWKLTPFEYFGTGFFISKDGLIATNKHVAAPWVDEEYKNINVAIGPNFSFSYIVEGQSVELGVIPNHLTVNKSQFRKSLLPCDLHLVRSHSDPNVDLSVIQLQERNIPPHSTFVSTVNFLYADKEEKIVKREDGIVVIAFPFGFGMWKDDIPTIKSTFDVGHIANITHPYVIQHSAPSAGGASGGILYHKPTGKVIGVNYGGKGNNHNLAIMIKYLDDLR